MKSIYPFLALGWLVCIQANAADQAEPASKAFEAGYYTCYAQTPDGTRYSASGYGSPDRIQQQALDVCVAAAHYNCKRAGCQ
jgi:hypothetical protein